MSTEESLREAYKLMTANSYFEARERIATLLDEHKALQAERETLRRLIRDIDAHARPLGTDSDGFVSGGYVVTVGAMHRALSGAGTAASCKDVPCERAEIAERQLAEAHEAIRRAIECAEQNERVLRNIEERYERRTEPLPEERVRRTWAGLAGEVARERIAWTNYIKGLRAQLPAREEG